MAKKLSPSKFKELEALIRVDNSRDPLYSFKPHERQIPFINAVLYGEKTENWLLTANRFGKSIVGAYCGSKLARDGNPDTGKPTTGWVISLDNHVSRDVIEPMYFDNGFVPPGSLPPFIPRSEITEWRIKDKILKLKNGSIIGFKSCESKGKFPGTGKDWIHFDEPPDIMVYRESTFRIAAGKKLRVFATCTLLPPEGKVGGISWVFAQIVRKIESLPNIQIFRGSIYDNPYIPYEEIQKLESKYPEGDPVRRIRLNGELIPGIGGARIYSPFERSIHVKTGLEFHTRSPLCWTWDFNVQPMVSLVGQRQGDLFKVFRTIWLEQGHIFTMVDRFKEIYPTHGSEIYLYGDSSGNQRGQQTNKSNWNLILKAMSDYPVPVQLKVPEKNPGVIDRINAVNYALKDDHGNCGVEVDPCNDELIQDLEEVISDGKGGIKKTSAPSDPYFWRTHASDALGYWIHKSRPSPIMTYSRQRSSVVVPGIPSYAFQIN